MKSIPCGRLAVFAFAISFCLAPSSRTERAQAADDAATLGRSEMTIYHFAGDRPSWVYQLKVNGQDVPVTALPNIDEAACRRIVAGYDKLPKQCRVPAKFVGCHYAHLAAAGDLRFN